MMKSKKLLSLLLVMIMLLTNVVSFAEEVDLAVEADAVATEETVEESNEEEIPIEDLSIEVIETEIDEAEADGVIDTEEELAAALAAGGEVILGGDIDVVTSIYIPESVEVTLDLSGYNINGGWNGSSTTNHIYVINNYGTLKINDSGENGAIVSRGVYNYGTLILNDGTIDACDGNGGYAVNNESGSTFTMNGGTLSVSYEDDNSGTAGGFDATALDVPSGCTTTLNGGEITSVTDYTFAIESAGILKVPEDSTVVVDGAHGAISVSGGSTDIAGGTFICSGIEGQTDNVVYITDGSFTVTGGTFTHNGADVNADSGAAVFVSGPKPVVTIEGGSFTGLNGAISGNANTTITGGTFVDGAYSTNHYDDVIDYVPVGTIVTVNGETLLKTEDGEVVTADLVISNLAELKWFRDSVDNGNTYKGKTVTLSDDIDLEGEEWEPIGSSSISFQGTFDGGNKTISNLVVNGGSNSNQGFFAYTTDGEIKNLTINNAKVSGRLSVGVVAGTPYTSKYTNIKLTGHVEVNGFSYVGGVGGKNAYADWTNIEVNVDETSFVNAYSSENEKNYRTYVGGVIGFMGEGGHTVKNVTSNINVEGNICDVGGIVGIAHYDNNFENVTCTATVTNTNPNAEDAAETGGIAGVWHNEKGHTVTFTNCSFTGKVVAEGVAENAAVGAAYNVGNYSEENSGSLVIDGATQWPKNFLASIGAKKYETLSEAFKDAADGDTIVVLDSHEMDCADYVTNSEGYAALVNVTGKKVTLDLNKKTITVNASAEKLENSKSQMLLAVFAADTDGELIITGEGTVKATANDAKIYSLITSYNAASKLTIENGNYELDKAMDSLIYSGTGHGNLTVNDGTFRLGNVDTGDNGKPWIFNAYGNNTNNIAVNGGTYNFDIAHQYWTFEVDLPKEKASKNNGDGTWTIVDAVAYVGEKEGIYTKEVGYVTLDDAVKAAESGEEVTILVDGTYVLDTLGKDLTIKAADGVSVTFDNIGQKNMGGANVTFENIIFDYYPNGDYTGLQHSGNLTYNNCTFNGQVFLYGVSDTFNECTFNQNSSDAYNVWTYSSKEVTFNKCTFNCAGKSVLVYNEGATATVLNVEETKFIATASVKGKAAIEIDTSLMPDGTTVAINNSKSEGFAQGSVSENELWNDKADRDNLEVKVNGTKIWPKKYIASVGGANYKSLEKAIAAAKANDTITFIDNITEDVTINKNITIEGAGFDYTGTMTVNTGLNVTIQNVDFVNGCITEAKGAHGYLTVKNCNFDGVDKTIGYAISVRGGDKLVIENSTAKNYGYGMLYIPSSVATVNVKDVVVSDVNAAFNISYSGDGRFENVKVSNANYGLHVQNYGARTFTMTGCEFDSKNPIYVQEKGTANVTFKFEGANDFGANEFTVSDYAILKINDADASLEACAGLNITTDAENSFVKYADGVYKLVKAVAQIGDAKYSTLEEAFNAAQANDTITILSDVIVDEAWDCRNNGAKFTVPVTIDGNNHTITLTGDINDNNWNTVFRFEEAATVKNLTVDTSAATSIQRAISSRYDITVDNCKFIGNGARMAVIFGEGAGAAIGNVTATVTNSTFTNWKHGVTDNMNGQDAKAVTVSGNTFTDASVMLSAAENVTFTDNNVSGGYVTISSYTAVETLNVNATGNTIVGEEDYIGVNPENVVADKEFKLSVAKAGAKYYATLEEAFKAAQANDTITILSDVEDTTVKMPATLENVTITSAEGVVIKNSTISAADGNSYKYVGLTFDGLTFDNSRILITGWRNGEEIVKDLTITNCTFKNLDDTTNSAPVHINKDAPEAVENFTFTNNVIDGATGGSKSGIYLQATGNVLIENNIINNTAFRPYVIQITTDDGLTDNFVVKGNTFSGTAAGRAQGLGNNAEGADAVNLEITENIFKDIKSSQQICYWNFNEEKTTTKMSHNYYDIDIVESPDGIYYNGAATSPEDLVEMGIFPIYTALNEDGTLDENSLYTYEVRPTAPNADVTVLAPMMLKAGEYTIYDGSLKTGTENLPLNVVMNFKANDTLEEAKESYYGEWKTDFYLTISGLSSETIEADDCYLAGNYGTFGWIVIPTDNMVLENGATYPIVSNYDANITYEQICGDVKDFTAAIHIAPEILAANPNMTVTLELKMTNPKDSNDILVVGEPAVYDVEDLSMPVIPTATVTSVTNDDLTFALNFKADEVTAEQLAYYGGWYADYVLTINKDVTFNANGGADGYLSGQYDEWSSSWVNVPFKNVSMKAGESLKIMEYAAELMGKTDLKLTYNDVYQAVRDFDCGVFFEPEFLIKNPDLEVKLELRMFNPADETISYTIGEAYSFNPLTLSINDANEVVVENVNKTVTLYVASYADEKATKLIDIEAVTISADYTKAISELISTDNAEAVKAFVWNNNMRYECAAASK